MYNQLRQSMKQNSDLSFSGILTLEETRLNGPIPQGESDDELDGYLPKTKKTNNLGSNQVQHKPGCTVREDG